MDIKIVNEEVAEIKDVLEGLKNTISFLSVTQGSIELNPNDACLEDIARSLYLVLDKQNEYVNLLENILNNL